MFATLSGGFWGIAAVVWFVRHMLLKRYMHRTWRLVRTFTFVALIAGVVRQQRWSGFAGGGGQCQWAWQQGWWL